MTDTRNSHITENPSPSDFSFLSSIPPHLIFTRCGHQYYLDADGVGTFGWSVSLRQVWGLDQPLIDVSGSGATPGEAYSAAIAKYPEKLKTWKRESAEAEARTAERKAREAEANANLEAALDAMLAKL
jgi:hypothetical protein